MRLTFLTCLLLLTLACIGCNGDVGLAVDNQQGRDDANESKLNEYQAYLPQELNIMPLTDFGEPNDSAGGYLEVYLSLDDAYGCQIKSPAVFRFELYKRLQRTAQPKGQRAAIWADIDMLDPDANNEQWQDFIRAYRFRLDLAEKFQGDYILQATCTCPDGRRLSDEFVLRL